MGVFTDNMAYKLMDDYGLDPMEDMKYDPHYNDEGIRYFVFANHRDRTNILIKFDPKEFT